MRDIDIRNRLKSSHLRRFYLDDHSRVVEELSLCSGDARVDIAVINGALHGYEIKSELDTLLRLPNQIQVYSKVFDYLNICTGVRHLSEIKHMAPLWCGIILASQEKKGLNLKIIRRASKNLGVDGFSIAQLLWKDEVINGLQLLGFSRGLSNKPKKELWQLFADVATPQFLSQYVRNTLKSRLSWRSDQQPF